MDMFEIRPQLRNNYFLVGSNRSEIGVVYEKENINEQNFIASAYMRRISVAKES